MERSACHENYPPSTVALANLQWISVIIVGAMILSGFGLIVTGLYVLYCAAMAVNVLRTSCVGCYYFGKVCFSRWGKLAPLFFKKGDPKKRAERELTWLSILPDFLSMVVPVVGGIALVIIELSWLVVILIAVIVVLSLAGSAAVRSRLACRYCRQREIGCPAERLFQKRTGAGNERHR